MSLPPFAQEPEVRADATISPCGLYRYDLTRHWGPDPANANANVVNFIMLNPSTADASVDDPTIRRCVGYAKAWGYDGLVVTNLYGLRATDPRELWKARDPTGLRNMEFVLRHARAARLVVVAWGVHGARDGKGGIYRKMLESNGVFYYGLRFSKDGQPCHPLYLPSSLVPTVFPGE